MTMKTIMRMKNRCRVKEKAKGMLPQGKRGWFWLLLEAVHCFCCTDGDLRRFIWIRRSAAVSTEKSAIACGSAWFAGKP